MRTLQIVKLATFSLNAVSTFMRYSTIVGMQNLKLFRRLHKVEFAYEIFVFLLRLQKVLSTDKKMVLAKIMEISVKKIFTNTLTSKLVKCASF